MKNELELKHTYWASVSGGKDSLLMFQLIIRNPDKYPLNGVVHFELEIDYPFIHDVVSEIRKTCNKLGIPFISIKPRTSWQTLYNKYGFPSSSTRWCNMSYKLDCKRQFEEMGLKRSECVHWYIGLCADETKRFKDDGSIYPLVMENINEDCVWEWAKHQPIFNNYYKSNRRCGCMLCPLASYTELAYLCKYYPNVWEQYIEYLRIEENKVSAKLGKKWVLRGSNIKYDWLYTKNIVETKWLAKLEEKENENERN